MNIQDILYSYCDKVVPTSGDEVRIDCPFCSDTKQHLYFNTVKGVGHCFKCEWAGSIYALVKEIGGTDSASDIWAQLRKPSSSVSDFNKFMHATTHKNAPQEIISTMPKWYVPFSDYVTIPLEYAKLVFSYAMSRMSYDNIIRYGVGYCSDPNLPYAMRMILPVERGYFQARSIFKNERDKYLNPSMDIGDRLFNGGILKRHTVYICEGILSSIAIGSQGCATLNKSGTIGQRKRLASATKKHYVLAYDAGTYDSDTSGDLVRYLRSHGHYVTMRNYFTGDPDDNTGWVDSTGSHFLDAGFQDRLQRVATVPKRSPYYKASRLRNKLGA